MMSKTFIKIESLQHLEISRRTGQKSAYQHSLFWRYATDFSKLMPTTHTSMASTFQCEYCQCFTFKICNKIHTKMYSPWVRVEYTSFFHCSCRQLVASFFYAVERREWTGYFCIISIESTVFLNSAYWPLISRPQNHFILTYWTTDSYHGAWTRVALSKEPLWLLVEPICQVDPRPCKEICFQQDDGFQVYRLASSWPSSQ